MRHDENGNFLEPYLQVDLFMLTIIEHQNDTVEVDRRVGVGTECSYNFVNSFHASFIDLYTAKHKDPLADSGVFWFLFEPLLVENS